MGKLCTIDLRVAGSSSTGQLMIFSTKFFSSYKNSLSTYKSSYQVPHQSCRVQTAVLVSPTTSP